MGTWTWNEPRLRQREAKSTACSDGGGDADGGGRSPVPVATWVACLMLSECHMIMKEFDCSIVDKSSQSSRQPSVRHGGLCVSLARGRPAHSPISGSHLSNTRTV